VPRGACIRAGGYERLLQQAWRVARVPRRAGGAQGKGKRCGAAGSIPTAPRPPCCRPCRSVLTAAGGQLPPAGSSIRCTLARLLRCSQSQHGTATYVMAPTYNGAVRSVVHVGPGRAQLLQRAAAQL